MFVIRFTPAARRALGQFLPETVAVAVLEFITGTLAHDPRRVGKPLRDPLVGLWSARRGAYRVLYRIKDDDDELLISRIDHRSAVYRPR